LNHLHTCAIFILQLIFEKGCPLHANRNTNVAVKATLADCLPKLQVGVSSFRQLALSARISIITKNHPG
jgi:hypothetical protein